ncbi:MAG: hypothetical protein QM783_06660 [Phycisphaerales bacterium]
MSQPTNANTNPPSSSSSKVRKEGADRWSMVLSAALCTLLGVNLMYMAFSKPGPSSASAQVAGYSNNSPNTINMAPPSGVVPPPENIPSAPASSPEMLKRVVEQLVETNARLARIEAQFTNSHPVTVTNWPANIGNPPPPPPAPANGK